ncbi:hypothetical protein [Leptospira fletcheri]|nr:hypothetical protein [Leptospira fletcheri]
MKISPKAKVPKRTVFKKIFLSVWNKLPHGFRMSLIGTSRTADLDF